MMEKIVYLLLSRSKFFLSKQSDRAEQKQIFPNQMKPWTKIIKKKQIDGFENVYKPAYWHNSYEYIPTRTQIMMSEKKKCIYIVIVKRQHI